MTLILWPRLVGPIATDALAVQPLLLLRAADTWKWVRRLADAPVAFGALNRTTKLVLCLPADGVTDTCAFTEAPNACVAYANAASTHTIARTLCLMLDASLPARHSA